MIKITVENTRCDAQGSDKGASFFRRGTRRRKHRITVTVKASN